MAAAGAILMRTMELSSEDPRGRHDRRARRGGREVHPLAGRDAVVQGLPRLPRLDLHVAQLDGRPRDPGPLHAAARATSCRSTSASSWTAGSPTPRVTFAVGPVTPVARKLLDDDGGVAVRRRRAVPVGQPARRRITRCAGGRRGQGAIGRALARGPRHRPRHARGPADPQLRTSPARASSSRRGWSSPSSRWSPPVATRFAWATTTGRFIPRTARWPRTSSSRSRSPPKGRGSSPPGTRQA